MQIKRFEAQDMSEALKMIKREFGPQAVILSARDINKRKGVLGLLSSPGVEVTAATDTHNGNGKPKMENLVSRKWTLQKEPFISAEHKAPIRTGPSRPLNLGDKGRLKGAMRPNREKSHVQKNDNLILFLNLYEELQDQGVEEALASSLIENLRAETLSDEVLGDKEIKERLIDVLKGLGVADSTGEVKHQTHRVVVLVGPTGVGKTTTMAKMAVVETFQKGKEIALITLNDHRIGATAQMEAYGKILGVPMAAVSNRKELKATVKRFRDKDLILIDTPGISQNDIYGINELKALLEAVDPLEIHLMVSAGTKEKDFEHIFRKFGILPIDRLLFTKIDETNEYGSMLNGVVRTKLPLSYFTNGQQVPENIEEGSLERLVDLLWMNRGKHRHGSREFAAKKLSDNSRDRKNGFETKVYVANRNSDLFHDPSCKWVERIDERHMLVFNTRSEALANNFHPCKACHPGIGKKKDETSLMGATHEQMREMAAY